MEHPRFGKGPRRTGLDVAGTPDGKVFLHWHSGPGVRVPNTAVAADLSRQKPATVPVTHYFDAKRVCRKCGRVWDVYLSNLDVRINHRQTKLRGFQVDRRDVQLHGVCTDCR